MIPLLTPDSVQTLHIPGWCGCTTEYLPVPAGHGGPCSGPIGRSGGGCFGGLGGVEHGGARLWRPNQGWCCAGGGLLGGMHKGSKSALLRGELSLEGIPSDGPALRVIRKKILHDLILEDKQNQEMSVDRPEKRPGDVAPVLLRLEVLDPNVRRLQVLLDAGLQGKRVHRWVTEP